MTDDNTPVWIARTTAEIALREVDTAAGALDIENVTELEAAVDDLSQALDADAPRTTVSRQGVFDTIDVEGVVAGSLAIDYYHDTPRVLVYGEDIDEPIHAIYLPLKDTTEDDASPTEP